MDLHFRKARKTPRKLQGRSYTGAKRHLTCGHVSLVFHTHGRIPSGFQSLFHIYGRLNHRVFYCKLLSHETPPFWRRRGWLTDGTIITRQIILQIQNIFLYFTAILFFFIFLFFYLFIYFFLFATIQENTMLTNSTLTTYSTSSIYMILL